MDRIRIAAFDDNPIFRAGIVHVLSADPRMEVVAEGGSIVEALRFSTELSPDVVVIGSNLMVGGQNPTRSIVSLCPAVKILILTFSVDQDQALMAFASGARGYVLKGVSAHEFLEAVRAVHRGEGYVSPALAVTMLTQSGLARTGKLSNANPLAQLTHREGQIFNLLAVGLKNKEIGERLDLTEKSVKRYVTCIFEKLSVRNRVEAAMLSKAGTRPPNFHITPADRRDFVHAASATGSL